MRKPLVLAAVIVAVFACSDSTGPSVYLTPGAIQAPAVDTIAISDTSFISFAVLDIRGDTLGGAAVSGKAADSTVVTLVNDSIWVGKRVGSTTVTLLALDTLGVPIPGAEADVFVEVVPDQIASLTLSLATDSLVVGGTVTLTATELDSLGNTSSGHTITWISSDKAVATVVGGKVTAVLPGIATITAITDGGVFAQSVITVNAAAVTSRRRTGRGGVVEP